MIDAQLSRLSDTLFWVALVGYSVAMVVYFLYFASRKSWTGTLATVLAFAGLAVHGSSIAARGLAVGRVPWGNMFEYSSFIGFLVVGGFLILVDRRYGLRQLGGFALGAGVLTLATARLVYAPPGPLVPALNSYWIKIHVVAAMVSSSLFILAFIFTVLSLFKKRAERRGQTPAFAGSTVGAAYAGPGTEQAEGDAPADDAGFPEDHVDALDPNTASSRRARFPSAATLDSLAYRTTMIAFPIWTFAVIAGAIWANSAWGRYWGWDPKETWAFISWVMYAGYLHARATAGWRGTKAAVLNMVAFATLVFDFYAVNLWISGLHSYAGT